MADTENLSQLQLAIKAQAKVCAERGLPHFAPHNGICWSCHRAIYETEADGQSFVTGCPHCHRSYCD